MFLSQIYMPTIFLGNLGVFMDFWIICSHFLGLKIAFCNFVPCHRESPIFWIFTIGYVLKRGPNSNQLSGLKCGFECGPEGKKRSDCENNVVFGKHLQRTFWFSFQRYHQIKNPCRSILTPYLAQKQKDMGTTSNG